MRYMPFDVNWRIEDMIEVQICCKICRRYTTSIEVKTYCNENGEKIIHVYMLV